MVGDWDDKLDHKKFEAWASEIASGNFTTAWVTNDRERKHWPSAHQHWDRKPLNGRWVSIASLHGLGDAVQMFQYARALSAVTERLVFCLPSPLTLLAHHFESISEVADLADQTYSGGSWVPVELLELPYIFRTSEAELPLAESYLDRSGHLKERYRHALPISLEKYKVGIASQGGEWDRERWLSFEAIRPLLNIPDCHFVFLQGLPSDISSHFKKKAHVLHGDLIELAGTIANLDLVISIDSLSAHLAGALGIPCWLLLKKDPDWRWQRTISHTPWYPRTRVFRQVDQGDWSVPVSEVVRTLRTQHRGRQIHAPLLYSTHHTAEVS